MENTFILYIRPKAIGNAIKSSTLIADFTKYGGLMTPSTSVISPQHTATDIQTYNAFLFIFTIDQLIISRS